MLVAREVVVVVVVIVRVAMCVVRVVVEVSADNADVAKH